MERVFFDQFKSTADNLVLRDPGMRTIAKLLKSHVDGNEELDRSEVDAILSLAKQHHPEHLCHKDVYGGSRLDMGGFGTILMVDRNGLPQATPHHLREYNIHSFEERINSISEKAKNGKQAKVELKKTLSGLKKSHVIVSSCAPFMKSGTCFKLFNPRTHRFDDTGGDNCPNQRAGCAERILLDWEKHAISLFQKLWETQENRQDLLITNMIFPHDGGDPSVTYFNRNGDLHTTFVHLFPDELLLKPEKRTIYVSTLPCPDCTEGICKLHQDVPTEVHIKRLSRHGKKGNVVDSDDLQGLITLAGNGIKVYVSHDTPMNFVYRER